MKKNTVRRAARTGAIGLFTAALLVGATTGALATDGSQKDDSPTWPQIVSPSEYADEGGKDPQSMAPIGEAAPAQGPSVQKLTDLLTETTGLELFQAPAVEEYEELGQTLTFNLGDGNYEHPLNITRLTVHNDVPSSVLSSDGDETSTTTLPNGSHLLTAVGTDGIRVSTLSKGGQLTVWEAPATTEQNAYAADALVRWARTVDEQGITASHSPVLAIAAAKPKCQLTQSRAPFRHGGSLRIQADAAMICDQTGRGNFAASLRQYHGLGIWRTKDVRGYTNEQGRSFPVILRFECSRLTISRWQYRSNIGNATLRNSNGTWGASNVFSQTAGIHCA
ncbi:hypothetical protein [Streptomyces sp. NPDC002328]|uniref:hypothetical protein n=1 Tax=Streptomyces sp. NPDC002328 TaxID=3364642 RepID=UPI00368764E7